MSNVNVEKIKAIFKTKFDEAAEAAAAAVEEAGEEASALAAEVDDEECDCDEDDLVDESRLQVTVRNGILHFQNGTAGDYTRGNRPKASEKTKARVSSLVAKGGSSVVNSLAGSQRKYVVLEWSGDDAATLPDGSLLQVPDLG